MSNMKADCPGSGKIVGVLYLLPAVVCAVLWLGVLILFLLGAKYPPYHTDMIVGAEPGSYDAFLENRRIAKILKVPLESHVTKVTLVFAGAWAVFCGWRLKKNGANKAALGKALMGIGAVTMAMGILVLPFIIARGASAHNACINILRQLDGCKEQWALEHKKTPADTPTWRDLVGKGKYLQTMPECPGGGRFTIQSMSVKPTCSIAAHTLP